MKWRYGVVKYKQDNYTYYGIGELYFKNDPLKIFACSEKPVKALVDHDDWVEDNDPIRDITDQLKMMLKDCEKYPIFDSEGPYESNEEENRQISS